jgi:cephalosporin hydroxylase
MGGDHQQPGEKTDPAPDKVAEFFAEVKENVARLGRDTAIQGLSNIWIREVARYNYYHNFTWMGRPIIQLPQDILAMQEIIWRVQPDLIVEMGIAHGGSLIFYASMLELIGGDGQVVGVDIDIRAHNRREIEKHKMFSRIRLIQGSSVEQQVAQLVHDAARGRKQVMVCLDSSHTHAHVLKELNLYSPLVKRGSYLVVFDTFIEDFPDKYYADRPWNKGNSPRTAVREFLAATDRFVVDHEIEAKLQITANPGGYLKCVKD